MRPFEDAAIQAGACTRENTPQDVFEACVDGYAASQGAFNARVQLQPVGEPGENNAYVSYGDRLFKVVIYNDDFRAVAQVKLNELSYVPSHWADPYTTRDHFDVSGTSKDNPGLMTSILLEDKVFIEAVDVNGYEIDTIEALDVPEGAVLISED